MSRPVTSGEIAESDDGTHSTALPLSNEAGNEYHHTAEGRINNSASSASTKIAPTSSPSADNDSENQIAEVEFTGISSLNNEAGNEIAIPIPEDAAATPTTTEAEDGQPPETQFNEYHHTAGSPSHQSMHRAAIEGDWVAAELLLREDRNLAWQEITEQGDRALHLAVSRKHTEFVRKLVTWMEPHELKLYDGDGYTACCYAAMAGKVEVVRIMMEADSTLVNEQNWYRTTPFALAISYGNTEIVEYFLSVAEIEGLEEVQWFDLLLIAIASKMFELALTILAKKGNLAEMTDNDNRTALHVLAQLDISSGGKTGDDGYRKAYLLLLTRILWKNIQNLGRDGVVELMKNPPILHDAAKVGNLDLIKMITYDYPDLLSHIDQDGYSIFHIIVMHRKPNILEVVRQARNVKDFNRVSQDKNGNNLLHSAGKSISPKGLEIVAEQDVQMQRAFAWFKAVEAIVPPIYLEMRNKDGYTPTELFWKEHAKLLATSEAYMKRTAESCMLISTIVLTLVFAAAFAPPGGFTQDGGTPILLKKKGFAFFIIFQILALFSSTLSIIGFWSIISSNYEEHQFFVLPHYLRLSMCALLLSVLFVISAFLSAFFLVFVQERKALALTFMLPLYVVLVVGISYQLFKVLRKTYRLYDYNRIGGKLK